MNNTTRILLDTNVFIPREDSSPLGITNQGFWSVLHRFPKIQVLIHPASIEEIRRDRDEERRRVVMSKVETYQRLEGFPDFHPDSDFISKTGSPKNPHDEVDLLLLLALYRDSVDFLVTNDKELTKKANLVGLSERIFTTEEATQYIARQSDKAPKIHPMMENVPLHTLNIEDPFFQQLRDDYPEFRGWWKKISRQGRNACVVRMNGVLWAILILKNEDEAVASFPPLPRKKRLKICTLYVHERGLKIGERLIRTAIDTAIANDIGEIYLTHFTKPDDSLVNLIEEYGFEKYGYLEHPHTDTKEDLFLKELLPSSTISLFPTDLCRKYYPTFYGGPNVKKFVVPIRPAYHERLFEDFGSEKRSPLFPSFRMPLSEGFAIKKAYLSHSRIKSLEPGDLTLFYRSDDRHAITSIGIVDKSRSKMMDPNEIVRFVGKRTVYTQEEIEEFSKNPTLAILFRFLFHLKTPLDLNQLISSNVLKGAPQSITKINDGAFQKIISHGGIDEHFVVH